jgi:NAD(P)-dependent dehydrogenase (short-subunit alcohol dehydrogenase family)
VARVFITGSSDGLGLMAARLLIEQGHKVVLHGRNDVRSRDALLAAEVPEELLPGTSLPSPERGPLLTRSTSWVALTP